MMKYALLLFCIFLVSCGARNRNPSTREYYLELQGQWISPCISFMNQYRIQNMVFDGYNLTNKETVYQDDQCSIPLTESVIQTKFDLGQDMSRILDRGHQIFLRPESVALKPVSTQAAADFNASSTCGYNDWVVDEYKDVSGRQCDANDKANPEVGKTYLNLIKIVENILTFGNDRCEIDNSCFEFYGQKYPKEYYPFGLQKQ